MRVRLHKALSLAGVLASDPAEFLARAASILEARLTARPPECSRYSAINQDEACHWLGEVLGCEATTFFSESVLTELEAEIAGRMSGVGRGAAIPLAFSADRGLARFCYALCRLKRPRVVIETGVSYGCTSAYILQAMEVNGCGKLASIDLPPLGADSLIDVGRAVPERLRGRWRLEFGSSRQLLGRLASELAPVDIFIHDSLHTYRTVKWELAAVAPFLAENAIGVCDDIESNSAFQEWLDSERVISGFAIRASEKAHSLFGISLLGSTRSAGDGEAHG
jgi:hypothetical protein